MTSAKRKLARLRNYTVKKIKSFSQPSRPKDIVGRVGYLENALDNLTHDFHVLKAEFQMAGVRQQALVDYYETRIDRIYARLSAETARTNGIAIEIAQDSQSDDAVLAGFKQALQVKGGYVDIPLASALSDHIEPGAIRGPLTLQGFKIRRGLAQEMGDGVQVHPLTAGKQQTVLYGPYKKLLAGQYVVTLLAQSERDMKNTRLEGGFDIYCPSIDLVLGEAVFSSTSEGGYQAAVTMEWPLEHAGRELEFRVQQRSLRAFKITGFDIERK